MKTLLLAITLGAATAPGAVDEPLRAQAVQVLRASLDQESRWIKVHAAEALLATGNGDGVARAFEQELASHADEKEYRIGIWRVLAQAAREESQREAYVRKILAAFLDTAGPDRLHAAETLGKLGYRVVGTNAAAFDLAARRGPLAADARWVLVNSGAPGSEMRLIALLASDDRGTRNDAAYALRHLPKLSRPARARLTSAVLKTRSGDGERVTMLSAAFVHAPRDQQARFKTELLTYLSAGTNDEKIEACAALAAQGVNADVPQLAGLLTNPAADIRIAAARAILRIDKH